MEIHDLKQVLSKLSADRPVFHSEADFQHSIAWRIHERSPSAAVRLEMPFRFRARSVHVDILVDFEGVRSGIELKYKTRALWVMRAGESYELKDQSAQDLGRYDFLLDVQRIEELISQGLVDKGASLLLTNDSAYWKSPRIAGTIDAEFRLHDGRMVEGDLSWGRKASKGTTSGREASISLGRSYRLHWHDYSEFAVGSYASFRYLLLEA